MNTYEDRKDKRGFDIDRLRNPFLLHPEDYHTQHELFEAVKHWDIWEVKEWRGHEKIDITQDDVQYVKNFFRTATYDWLSSVLKYYKTNKYFIK